MNQRISAFLAFTHSNFTQTRSNPVNPDQGKSNQIKPNQTCGAVGVSRNWTIRCGKRSEEGSLFKTGQTKSNRVKPGQTQVCSKKSSYVSTESRRTVSGQTQSKVNQTKSNQIKPARGKYLWHMDLHRIGMEFGWVLGLPRMDANRRQSIQATTRSNPVKPNQGESNQIKPNQTCEVEAPMPQGVAQKRNGVRRDF